MKKILMSCAFAASLAPFATVAAADVTIGVSMTSFDNPFLTILLNGMKEEADKHDDVTLLLEDAQLDVPRQFNQIENFIANGVDAIIVNPVDGAASLRMTKAAIAAGIPIVYSNHPPAEADNMPAGATFVGSNEVESGTMQTEAVCEMLGGQGKILVLVGALENHSAIVRTKDIEDVIAKDPCTGMEILDKQVGNWNRTQGADITANWLTTGMAFDAIIANNDEMAIGAIMSLKAAGTDMDSVIVAGIDATPDGLAALETGDLDVTVYQNATRQGIESVKAAMDMAAGNEVPGNIWVPFEPVTRDNIADFN